MKTAVILSLAGSSLAMPFGNIIGAVFGNHEARQASEPDHHHHHHHHHQPTGTGFPFPTGGFPAGGNEPPFDPSATAVVPTGTGFSYLPVGPLPTSVSNRVVRRLQIDYNLAPRQDLPSFSLLPSGPPASTPAFPFPTGGEPPEPTATDGFPEFPTGGFPVPTGTGGAVPFPTTLETLTRGPRPTGIPDAPESPEQPGSPDWWDSWKDWISSFQNDNE